MITLNGSALLISVDPRSNLTRMFRHMLLTIVVWSCIAVAQISAQGGAPCQTPSGRQGVCVGLDNCPFLLNLVLTQSNNSQTRSFLRASVCGSVNGAPKVCCPPEGAPSKLPRSPNCGFSNVTVPRIVNGVPAKLGEFPWIVALGYRNTKNPQVPKWLCGGSLITDRHILTAAHCVQNRKDLYLARLGDLDLFSDDDGATPSSIPLSRAKIHEEYNPNRFTNDIAILTLSQPVNNPTVWPVCLPTVEPYRSMSYLNFSPALAGWGAISFQGPSSSVLQQIFLPVVDNQACARVFSRQATIDNKIICAGSTNGDKDACGGDSGGPLMNEVNEGTHYRVYQIGIVSYGFRCAEPGYPGVYTRVTSFLDWIERNVD